MFTHMDQERIYQGSMAVIGIIFAVTGLRDLSRQGIQTSAILMTIGGLIIVVAVGYALGKEIELGPDHRSLVWMTLLGAVLSTVGAFLVFF